MNGMTQPTAEQRTEAIRVIREVISLYKGTLQEHQVIQSALDVLIKMSDPANNLQIHEFIPAEEDQTTK
jgi:hypothetical protein